MPPAAAATARGGAIASRPTGKTGRRRSDPAAGSSIAPKCWSAPAMPPSRAARSPPGAPPAPTDTPNRTPLAATAGHRWRRRRIPRPRPPSESAAAKPPAATPPYSAPATLRATKGPTPHHRRSPIGRQRPCRRTIPPPPPPDAGNGRQRSPARKPGRAPAPRPPPGPPPRRPAATPRRSSRAPPRAARRRLPPAVAPLGRPDGGHPQVVGL